MYLVLAVKKEMTIRTPWGEQELPFSDAGMFGMCPVFEKLEDAMKYADGKFDVQKVAEVKE